LDVAPTRAPLTVLLAVDGSSYSDAEATLVTGIAWPAGTAVRVLAVVRGHLPLEGLNPETQRVVDASLADLRRQEWAAAETLTTQVVSRLRAHSLTVDTQVREGRPAAEILEQAGALSADLIVIGAKGLSAPDSFRLGAAAHKLAHYADCSVLVVRPPERAQLLSAILATDGSPEAQRAAEFLCALSLPRWTEVTVVSVAEAKGGILPGASLPESLRRTLFDAAKACADEMMQSLCDCGAQVRSAVRFGHPADEILAAAQEQDADLIVVGARGRTRAGPFRMGDVAQKAVKYASCSVLVVR
jgi:nucleotide-binding universal stress UspA family protein